MSDFALPPGMDRHARQLWGAVAELCRAGFAVDPYEARVLFADFGIEAWQDLAAQFPQRGTSSPVRSFERALTRQFYNYAATSLAPLGAARWRLRDLQSVLRQPPRSRTAGAWRVLADALTGLPEHDVDRLLAFRAHGLPCEWQLAADDGGTIRDARAALAQAAARWVELAVTLAPQSEQPVIARELWSQGSHVFAVARRLRLPVERVEGVRMSLGTDLATALDNAASRRRSNGRTALVNNDFSAILVLLARGDDREAQRRAARYGARLLEQLDASDDLQLDDEAAHIAERHPETLAKAYRLLLDGPEDRDEPTESALHAWRMQQRASQHVAEAFDALIADLPHELVDWSRVLPRDAVGKFDTTVPGGSESTQLGVLRHYGLAPESFVGIARSLQLQCDSLRNRNAVPAFFAADDAPDPVEPADEPVILGMGQLRACVRTAPHVPGHAGLVDALARWTLDVVSERPHFVPGYDSDRSSTDDRALVAVPRASARAAGAQDLRALWIARRPSSRPMAAGL